jgi:hypothetical protein
MWRRTTNADFLPSLPRPRRVSPRQARYFLVARQESTQRSVPRLPGLATEGSPEARPIARRTAKQLAVRNPALTPRCGRPAGAVAKLGKR